VLVEKKSKTMQTSEESVDRLVMARMIPPKKQSPIHLGGLPYYIAIFGVATIR